MSRSHYRGRTRWMAGLIALPIGLAGQAVAQVAATDPQPARATVRVAPVIIAEPEVETALSIQVGPDAALPRQTFLRIRGLPLSAKLSEGHVVSPGVWAVPLSAVPSLRLLAPLAGSGRTELNLALVSVDGGVIAETRASLVVAPAWLLSSSGARQETPRTLPAARPEPPPQADPPTPLPQPTAVAAPPPPTAEPLPPPPKVVQAPAPAQRSVPVPPPPPPPSQPLAQPAPKPVASAMVEPPPPAPAPRTVVAALPPPATYTPVPAPPPALATPPPPPAARVAPPAAKATQSAPVQKAIGPVERARAEDLVRRGDGFIGQGNLAAARQFFRRAADMGLGLGALRLGATFDPIELAGMRAVGVQPDPKEAALWYERARDLGVTEAGARLSRLQGR